jgi:ribosomal protein L4
MPWGGRVRIILRVWGLARSEMRGGISSAGDVGWVWQQGGMGRARSGGMGYWMDVILL